MNDEVHGSDELARLVRNIAADRPEEGVDRAMDEQLEKFRGDLAIHPYVQRLRKLQRRSGLRPARVWFIGGQPIAARWAMAAVGIVIVAAAGLTLTRGSGTAVVWAEVADRVAAIDRMKFSMRISVTPSKRAPGEEVPSEQVEPEGGRRETDEAEGAQPPPTEGLRSVSAPPSVESRRGRGADPGPEQAPSRADAAAEEAGEVKTLPLSIQGSPAGEQAAEMDFWLSDSRGFRWDVLADGQPVSSLFIPAAAESMVWLLHEEQAWIELPVDRERPARSVPAVEEDPEAYLRRFVSGGYRELEPMVIDGVRVIGIEVDDPPSGKEGSLDGVGRLWVDEGSGLPFRLELIGRTGGGEVEWTFDFRWGEQVDPAGFEPEIPPGYEPPPGMESL